MSDTIALKLTNYSFTYPNSEKPVFGPLNFEIVDGEFVLMTGDTGCGKTTLLKSLLPGDVVCGNRTGETVLPESDSSTPSVAYVSQSPENQLVCETVWHELAFSLENYGTQRSVMRRRVAEVSHFFGIEPWFHKNINELSGGQMQIVSLARALATGPKLLLLDEPTAQLDPVAEKNFLHALFRINRELGITIVVVTHEPVGVRDYATREIRLQEGQIFEVEGFSDTPSTRLRSLRAGSPQLGEAPALQLNETYFRYNKDTDWVLRGMDLAVREGEIRALVGGNGCGKSTTLKIMAAIKKPQKGHVKNEFAQNQAYMPQSPMALFVCDTVEEEMKEWQRNCGYSDEAISCVLEKVGLQNKLEQHPFDLSGGEQQLLAMAKLLITQPKLLLLDEPTKGLDAKTKLAVANLIQEFAVAGGTVLMATHDLSFALCVANITTLIFDGQATCTEPSSDFFANNMFYRPTSNEFTTLFAQNGARE